MVGMGAALSPPSTILKPPPHLPARRGLSLAAVPQVMSLEDDYLLARYHVTRAEEFLSKQREIIEYLDSKGLDTSSAEDLLRLFDRSLARTPRHRACIEHQRPGRNGKRKPP